jgi:hypothetical protein
MGMTRTYQCNICDVNLRNVNTDGEGVPGSVFVNNFETNGWVRGSLETSQTIHICVICGPGIANAMGRAES